MYNEEHQRLKKTLRGSWLAAITTSLCATGLMAFHLSTTATIQDRVDNPDKFIAEKIKQYTPVCNPDADLKVLEQNPQRDMTCENKWAQVQMNQAKLTLKNSKAMTFAIGGVFGLAVAGCAGMIIMDTRRLIAHKPKPE